VLSSEQGLVLAEEAAVAGHLSALTGDDDLLEADAHGDATADEARVDRVVVGVDPHEVIPRQPRREPPRRIG
jgi:hypothetical protein